MSTYVGQAIFGGTVDPVTVTWNSATALNTALNSSDITGYGVIGLSIKVTGTITAGTIIFEVSDDGGTSWWAVSGVLTNTNSQVANYPLIWGSSSLQFSTGTYNLFRVRLNPVITGTGSVAIRITAEAFPYTAIVAASQAWGPNFHVVLDDGLGGNPVNVSVKGTQGTNALTVQDFKDAGRTYVTFLIDAQAGTTTEGLKTFTINDGGTTSNATSYTVTAGKTFRIQSMFFAVQATNSIVQWAKMRLRAVPTGAVTATSPVLAAAIVANNGNTSEIGNIERVFPDGLEVSGGSQLGITAIAGTTSTAITVSIVGYEY